MAVNNGNYERLRLLKEKSKQPNLSPGTRSLIERVIHFTQGQIDIQTRRYNENKQNGFVSSTSRLHFD